MKEKKNIFRFLKKNFPMIIVIAVVFSFVIYQFSLMNSNALATQIAVKSTVYDTVKTQAVFLREEQTLNQVDGIVVQSVPNGGKVSKDSQVAKVFSNQETAANYTKIVQLQEKLKYFMELKSMTLGEATGIEAMNSSIQGTINSIVRNKNNNDFVSIQENQDELNDLLVRRQILVGKTIDFDASIADLNAQIDTLNKSGAVPKTTVISELSGNFSAFSDGFEDYYNYSEVKNMTVEQVTTAISDTSETKESSAMGKMITGFQWYIACVMDSSVVASFAPGTEVSVVLSSDSSVVVNARVLAKNVENIKAEKTALILVCDEMNEKLSNLRNEKVEIRLKNHTGLRVDNRAIAIKDEKQGVYVLVANKVVFREIQVIYSGDGFVICSINNESANNIQIYDNVIIQGKELYDGKFIN